LIGPSAAGKTTALKVINGLEPFDQGEVAVEELTLRPGNGTGPTATLIRLRVGMVFQHLNLWPYKTVLQNITEGLVHVKRLPRPKATDIAREWSAQFGIEDQLEKYPNQLSGGQRQRVAIARAVVMQPKFLLLDEITSALDPVLAGEIVDSMVQLKEHGMGIVLVTHQLEFVRRRADCVYFLEKGRIVESGPARATLESPKTAALCAFIESVHRGW
jgi:polar amino acid transport system ATP-binding protein